MKDIKIGDYVRLAAERPVGWASSGAMDKYLNTVVKVISLSGNSPSDTFKFDGIEGWVIWIKNIVEIVEPSAIIDNYSPF